MTDTAVTATGLDTTEAASLISDLITDDLQIADQNEGQQAQSDEIETLPPQLRPKPAADEGEQAPTDPEETRSEDDEKSEEGEGDEEATQDDEEGEKPSGQTETFTVKIDGKEVTVPKDEVIAGYQRQADYTRKTQELSQHRQAFEENVARFQQEAQAVVQERGQYKQLLGQLQQALDQLYPEEPDWAELYARDKQEFLVARDNWREYQAQRAAAQAELDRVRGLELATQQRTLAQHIEQGRAKLIEWEPRWQDAKALRDDFTATLDYAKRSLGYTDQELAAANDHRALYAVHKARLYDELMAKAKEVKQKAAQNGNRKVLPAGSSARNAQTQQGRSKNDGLKRLVKGGGRVEDAAALMQNMLDL